jgi:hypothetical protein
LVPQIGELPIEPVGRGLYQAFDGKEIGAAAEQWIESALKPAVESIGVPCFLRTGQTSNKHNWKRTCYLDTVERPQLLGHVLNIIEFSEICDMIGIPWNVWAIRELLPTRHLFRCTAYGDMPAVREFRFFVSDGEVRYNQPYWPKEAIEDGKPDCADWEALYPELIEWTDRESQAVHELATKAAAAVTGQWSIDILDTTRGWYITDMAIAENSWGYDESRMQQQ